MINKIVSIIILLFCLVIIPVVAAIFTAIKIIADLYGVIVGDTDLNDVF